MEETRPERKILQHKTSSPSNKVIQSRCRLVSSSNSQYEDMKVEIHTHTHREGDDGSLHHTVESMVIIFLPEGAED